jgi:hypothetical protein
VGTLDQGGASSSGTVESITRRLGGVGLDMASELRSHRGEGGAAMVRG